MNILYLISSVLVVYISITECNNSTTHVSNVSISSACYYCSNCPRPFNPNSPYVQQVSTSTGWCAMMSSTSSPNGIYTRGAAQPGICYSNGCSWKMIGRVNTWVCCCDQNLCNTGVSCYYCSTCPQPFTRYSTLVSTVYSTTAWCAKKSRTNTPDAYYSRGMAESGLCAGNGCSWKMISGVNTWTCCCNQDKCNAGVSTSKSVISILSVALIMVANAHISF